MKLIILFVVLTLSVNSVINQHNSGYNLKCPSSDEEIIALEETKQELENIIYIDDSNDILNDRLLHHMISPTFIKNKISDSFSSIMFNYGECKKISDLLEEYYKSSYDISKKFEILQKEQHNNDSLEYFKKIFTIFYTDILYNRKLSIAGPRKTCETQYDGLNLHRLYKCRNKENYNYLDKELYDLLSQENKSIIDEIIQELESKKIDRIIIAFTKLNKKEINMSVDIDWEATGKRVYDMFHDEQRYRPIKYDVENKEKREIEKDLTKYLYEGRNLDVNHELPSKE